MIRLVEMLTKDVISIVNYAW